MNTVKKLTTREIFAQNQSRKRTSIFHKSSILLHNIRSMHNVGSVFRSADGFGIQKLYLSGFTPVPPRPEISKAALGAEEFVPWEQVNAVDLLSELGKTHTIIGIEQTNQSENMVTYQPDNRPFCIIMGNEVKGLDSELFPFIHTFLEIPQFGKKHSFNVSVTAGISLYALFQKIENISA